MTDWMTPRIKLAISLYQQMPGAEMPPSDERGYLWGEVDSTEHWAFCERVADKVERMERANAKMLAALEAVRNAGAILFHLEGQEKYAPLPRLDELQPELFEQVKDAIAKAGG